MTSTFARALAVGSGLALVLGGALSQGPEVAASASPTDDLNAVDTGGSTSSAVIDWNDVRQEVDGFGGAFAFHKAGSIQRLGDPLSGQILDMIFNQEDGIGLDIVRVMVGDGSIDEWGDDIYDGPTETIMPEPGVFVWDDPDWEDVKDDFDAYQIWLMKEAKERGVDTVLASVWSPPAWMKENESATGGGPNRLRDDMYQEFADYLSEYVLGYKEHFDIDIGYISPTNEPDLSTGYSSSEWTPEELNVFVRDYLGPTFAERDVPAQIVVGEAVGFGEEWVRPALNDPQTVDFVDVVAAHAYTGLVDGETAPNPDRWTTSNELGKRIWQTEYMNNGAPRDRLFVNNTITDGLRYANLIGNMFDQVSLNAYFWWWPASNSGADGSNLIRLQNDGSPQGGNPTETGEIRVFKRYYAFGNYSRFLEPGYVMIGADARPVDDVLVTAYKDPETENFTVVAVNNGTDDHTIRFDLDGFPADVDAVVPYRTSASENLKKLDPVAVSDAEFTVALRGSSVTTFIPENFELPALPAMRDVFSTYPAEENDGQSPGLKVTDNPDGGSMITNIRHGTHLEYSNVNFADGSAAGFVEQMGELRMHARVAPMAGGTISVRLGDPRSGPVVGELEVPAADDPDACRRPWTGLCPDEWITVSTDIDTSSDGGAYGVHDMYLVFENHPRHNLRMFNLDYAEFSD
ncbi:glycoside hydrolase [Phytoactinopolyspora mesophila]|uniref:Carbohydrate-binding protein n=1 Tax=Phytoactinopolyspora mesophila TaxID=2650750 RepID=A0A7K3M3Q1_9ACTN|nr:carbohydrate-binding protein [Phytoactinopolyspora mesophila]